ncbi:hypothetical protein SAMN05421847_1688 [Halpernia humi]|uniref:Uncharacterized protein n=1 Tax=Halpernia humi TaxID=493375 RepID=A0A1H5Y5Q8_9FLAO|nr:hypothetical protein [Halpernia humi]SEG19311.1 hypothetical protein SAMN05421847_1688 [Halpernia humi]
MKNFDIEKLDRKTPYDLPENTFAEIQRNVFDKVEIKKETPIFSLKWIYAAAAVILLIVSANFLINFNKNDGSQNVKMASKNVVVPQENSEVQSFAQTTEKPAVEKTEKANLTSTPISHHTANHQLAKNENSKSVKSADLVAVKANTSKTKTTIMPPTEAQIDEVLNGFSSAEIASLSNNSEQDVYLDLYN